jgi:hypothetical protein
MPLPVDPVSLSRVADDVRALAFADTLDAFVARYQELHARGGELTAADFGALRELFERHGRQVSALAAALSALADATRPHAHTPRVPRNCNSG